MLVLMKHNLIIKRGNMSKTVISEPIREFFKWCDNHPGFKNAELYAAYPNESESSLRTRKSKWEKYKKEGKWPDKETDRSINKSNHASTELEKAKKVDKAKQAPDESTKTNHPKVESINTSKDTFINDLFEKKETLFNILDEYQKTGSLPLEDIKLEKPFKTVSYSLMESMIEGFIQVCNKIGLSQRKALHIALNDFVQKYD